MEFEKKEATGPENEHRLRPWEERNDGEESLERIRERRISEEQEALSKTLEDFRRS